MTPIQYSNFSSIRKFRRFNGYHICVYIDEIRHAASILLVNRANSPIVAAFLHFLKQMLTNAFDTLESIFEHVTIRTVDDANGVRTKNVSR
jgi:hypothetical protein